jgi:hypothetical protein
MAQRCATLSEFLTQAPEFKTVGPVSTGTVTVAINPAPGDKLTIADTFTIPAILETFTAGTDYAIGATPETTAANLATALNNTSALVSAQAVGAAVTLVSKGTGSVSLYALGVDDPLSLILSGPTLEGGDAQASFALSCACAQINLACWGVKADCAHVYLTGHFLALQSGTGGGGGGAINRKKIDKIEIGYQTTAPSDGDLGATKWGRLYLQLRKSIFIPPLPGRRILPIVC